MLDVLKRLKVAETQLSRNLLRVTVEHFKRFERGASGDAGLWKVRIDQNQLFFSLFQAI